MRWQIQEYNFTCRYSRRQQYRPASIFSFVLFPYKKIFKQPPPAANFLFSSPLFRLNLQNDTIRKICFGQWPAGAGA